MKPRVSLTAIAALALASLMPASVHAAGGEAQELPRVERAWVRSAVAGQQGTGAFMAITAPRDTNLVAASTPVAGTAEVHEMKMDRDVMRMRPVPHLELPAGRTIELKPGGYHLMLLDLKQPLKPGSQVPLTLTFRDRGGTERKLELQVPVSTLPPPGGHAAPDSHKH